MQGRKGKEKEKKKVQGKYNCLDIKGTAIRRYPDKYSEIATNAETRVFFTLSQNIQIQNLGNKPFFSFPSKEYINVSHHKPAWMI